MSEDTIDLETLGDRLAEVRRTYGESIDVPNLGSTAFATLLGVSTTAYASCERGEREPTVDLLLALRHKTRISLDWFLDPTHPGADRP
ncbi:MAG TPA: helix-turn-helix transcriptional regulator [Acetobacteraceae bacterium]|nr:helix-turn-helix transcriptional regulator [Acetobacteraceae bacterium]